MNTEQKLKTDFHCPILQLEVDQMVKFPESFNFICRFMI